MRLWIGILLFALIPLSSLGQSARAHYRQGVKAMKRQEYPRAELHYRQALGVDSTLLIAHYGLGNALYRQEKYEEALAAYGRLGEHLPPQTLTQEEASELYHNLGNAAFRLKQYPQAVEAYKQALRLAPYDDSTRYNLALAQKLMDKNQPPQSEQSPQAGNPPPEGNPPPQQQPKPHDPIDSEAGKKILEAYQQDENEARRKYQQRQNQQAAPNRNQKNW